MIEAKLLVGRFLEFPRAGSRHLPSIAHTPVFVDVVCPALTIQESSRVSSNPFKSGARQSTVAQGTNATKMHRNFRWLPWYAGDISMTTLTADILTGPMSGCILTQFVHNGVMKAGHIGTVTTSDAIPNSVNTNVKQVWNNFANANPNSVLGGFNPCANVVPMHPPAIGDDVGGETWGLITTNGRFFAVQVYVQKGTTTRYRVAAVHPVNSMTPAQLQNL